jgi:hypothetical protein
MSYMHGLKNGFQESSKSGPQARNAMAKAMAAPNPVGALKLTAAPGEPVNAVGEAVERGVVPVLVVAAAALVTVLAALVVMLVVVAAAAVVVAAESVVMAAESVAESVVVAAESEVSVVVSVDSVSVALVVAVAVPDSTPLDSVLVGGLNVGEATLVPASEQAET